MQKKHLAIQRAIILSSLSFYFFPAHCTGLLAQPFQSPSITISDKQNLSAGERKISSSIRMAIARLKAKGVTSTYTLHKEASALSDPLVKIDEWGQIQSYIHLTGANSANVKTIRNTAAKIEMVNERWNVIQAWVPFDKFADLADLDFVQLITPPDYAIHMTGTINTEGDSVLRADEARATFGFDGTGIRVGVISDGVDTRADAQATADVPASIEINPRLPGSGDEGTAMLEIVHDLAPGVQLAFSGPQTSLEMIASINFLADSAFAGNGCQIIVDDLGFLTQPSFQDGSIAQTVETVSANGVTYLTATGNQADEHYEADYVSGALTFQGQQLTVHDFGAAAGGASDGTVNVTVDPGGKLTVVLQWSDPFPGSGNDYDLLLIDVAADTLVAISDDVQDGTQFPIEAASFENTAAAAIPLEIAVRNLGASPKLLEMFFLGSDFSLNEYNVPQGSVVPGQQSAKGAISVGAIFVLDPGNDKIEAFSSRGPARIFFPTIEDRIKPDISATDGNLITGAGDFGSKFGNDFRFFGTSSAAPHAAGVAALVLSTNQTLTPTQLRAALINSAVDLGVAGTDNTFGAGRIDAFQAVQSVITSVENQATSLPAHYALRQNYPNPFNPVTLIHYTLPVSHQSANVRLEIFNTLGQKVRTLINGHQSTGSYQVAWNGTDQAGRQAASGVYFYRLEASSFVQMKKMLLLR